MGTVQSFQSWHLIIGTGELQPYKMKEDDDSLEEDHRLKADDDKIKV